MKRTFLIIQTLLVALLIANPLHANNSILLDNNNSSMLTESVSSNINSRRVISKSQLIGIWADFELGSEFRSTWTFTNNYLTYRKYDGLEVSEKYSLRNNQIIIHHRKNVFNKGSWDEHINLISYDGKILMWELVGRFGIHKVK